MFIPHNRTVVSALPLARVCPSGLNTTEETELNTTEETELVRGWPSGVGCAGSATFHNRTVWSSLPVARVCPSGLNRVCCVDG
jgi:hypothetical protein